MTSTPSIFRRETFWAIFLIILTTLLTYGVLISQLGFYRDDWYLLWTSETQGMKGLIDLFRGDRPFIGWLYTLDFSILGTSALGWHVYALIIKVALVLAFFWLMRSLWPDQKVETTFITLLFMVYPGFYQQPNALTFKQLLIAYAAAMFSLALTINVIKTDNLRRKVVFSILALLTSMFYIFIYEPLVGLEVVRFILIVYVLQKQNKDWMISIRSAFKRAILYILFAGGFVFWRVFLFHSTRNATNSSLLANNFTSMHGFIRLFVETGKDLVETSILAWGVPFYQFSYQMTYSEFGLAIGLALLVILAAAGYYFLVKKGIDARKDTEAESVAFDWLVLGSIIVAVTTLPIVAAGRNVLFAIQWDRYTYQSVFGVALLVGGFVFYNLKGNLRWIVLTLLLVSGVSTQVFSEVFYRNFWSAQRETWWQLYWRAPQIKNDTTVITSLPGGYQLAEEYEVWAPLNLVYHRGEALSLAGQIPVSHLEIELERGIVEDRLVRETITVHRDYGKSIIISMPSLSSCLHVYNGSLPDISMLEPAGIAAMIPYSKTDFIQTDVQSPEPPVQIMGSEPKHEWCFYYQKINLALQAGLWTDAAKLADDAQAAGLAPLDPTEWMPVLESYANNGDDKKARRISTFINDKRTRLYICQQLKDVKKWPEGYRSDIIVAYMCNGH